MSDSETKKESKQRSLVLKISERKEIDRSSSSSESIKRLIKRQAIDQSSNSAKWERQVVNETSFLPCRSDEWRWCHSEGCRGQWREAEISARDSLHHHQRVLRALQLLRNESDSRSLSDTQVDVRWRHGHRALSHVQRSGLLLLHFRSDHRRQLVGKV